MKFSVYQVSRKGGRPLNEDRLGYTYTREAVLLVLADGMGGHPEGEKAAELAVRTFMRCFVEQARPRLADVGAFLQATLHEANQAIVAYAQGRELPDNPRTTLVAAVVQDHSLNVLHVGDSRLYWVRHGRLLHRTRDHSYQEQASVFKHAAPHVNRSVLFTCLGSPNAPIFDQFGPVPLQQGDRLLLCSDGLWGVMPDDDVAAGLFGMSLRDAVSHLSDLALRKGGTHGDNVSLLGLDWDTADDFEPTEVIRSEALDESVGYASSFLDADAPDLIDELDDDAIERTIAEINDAIRRTTLRRQP